MKKKIFKILVLIIIYVAISLGLFFILKYFGFNDVDKIRRVVDSSGGFAYVAFFILQIMVSTFVCIIPLEDEVLTASAIVLFGATRGFFVAAFNMFATSCIQFFLGRCLGKDIIKKILGNDSLDKYEKCLQLRGEIMLPVLYAVPFLPHDSLCILAGMSKMRFWYFASITLTMRSIEIAAVCFLGSGLIDFSLFSIADWIIVINVIIIDIYLLLKLHKYLKNKFNVK